jgi:hypothetical protein
MSSEKSGIFDSPKNVKRVLQILNISCIVLVVLDFVIHRHISHDWENIWAFYPLYGFVSCVILVIIASWIRPFLIRGEDYYDDEGLTQEERKELKSERLPTTNELKQQGADHVDN